MGVQPHETETRMVDVPPPEVDALAEIALKVSVSCARSCDLRGKVVRIVDQGGIVAKEVKLTNFDGKTNGTDGLTVKAPINPGGCKWRALFPAQEEGEARHEESAATFSFTVKPHATSMTVWGEHDLSPVVKAVFKVKVGVKCHAECKLTDKEIEVYDQTGKKVATGKLGGLPWAGTSALYWTELELKAPKVRDWLRRWRERYYKWTVKFPKEDLEVPHEETSYAFGFWTARPPEHAVTVELVDTFTKSPIKDAYVSLDRYRAFTDESGVARLEVPKGNYELVISREHSNIEGAIRKTIEVTASLTFNEELPPPPYPLLLRDSISQADRNQSLHRKKESGWRKALGIGRTQNEE